jgi:single-strand DNA-binding protein
MDLNKAMLIGRLTKNPELRSTPNGQSVTSFGLATNRYFTDPSGQKQEKTEFHSIVVWGKLAEICSQYLAKGRRAYIEGRLQTREWVAQDGTRRYSTEIIAENLIMLDPPSGGGAAGATRSQNEQPTYIPAESAESAQPDEPSLETIPF